MDPVTASAALSAGGKLIGGLFGKKKTKIKRKALSPEIASAMKANEANLKGDMAQYRDVGDAAFGDINREASGLASIYGKGQQTLGQYGPEGRQFQRSRRAIGRYGDALRASNQDALDSTTRQFNQQQALMGAGGSMSPFMAASLANQQGMLNRGVARELGGLEMANINRFQDIGMQMPMQQMGLFNAYAGSRQAPMQVLGRRDALTNQRLMGAIGANRAGHDTFIKTKDNLANKIGGAMQTAGGAIGGLHTAQMGNALNNAYMDRIGYAPVNTGWRGLIKGYQFKNVNPPTNRPVGGSSTISYNSIV